MAISDPRMQYRNKVRTYLQTLGISNRGIEALVRQVGWERASLAAYAAREALAMHGWRANGSAEDNQTAIGAAEGFLNDLRTRPIDEQIKFLIERCNARQGVGRAETGRILEGSPIVLRYFTRPEK